MSEASAGRFVGQAVRRREDPRLLTGLGSYVDDVVVPSMLHAAFVRSDVARRPHHAASTSRPAGALPGVRAVFTAADLNPDRRLDAADDVPGRPAADALRAAAAPRRRRRPLRRRPDRARRRRVPLRRRGRLRARRGRLRTAPRRHRRRDGGRRRRPRAPRAGLEHRRADRDHRPTPSSTPCSTRHPTSSPRRSCSIATRTSRWRPAASSPGTPRRPASSTCGSRPRTPTRCARPAPGRLGSPSTTCGSGSATSAAGSARSTSRQRDELTVIAAAHHLGRTVKWIEDRRENLIAANHARADRVTVRLALDDDARSARRAPRSPRGLRRLPGRRDRRRSGRSWRCCSPVRTASRSSGSVPPRCGRTPAGGARTGARG